MCRPGRDRNNAGVPPSQFRQVDEGRQGDRGEGTEGLCLKVIVGIEGGQREGQDHNVDQREKLTSRNGGSFKAQKLFHNRGPSHVGPGINGSDSSTKPLGHAQHSMPRLGKAQGIFNTGSHVRDGVIDIHSTYELIQKLQAQNHEYEGGHPLTQKSVQKHSRSQSRSKFIGFLFV